MKKGTKLGSKNLEKPFKMEVNKNDAKNNQEKVTKANRTGWRPQGEGLARH